MCLQQVRDGRDIYIFFFIFHLSSLSNVLSFGRRLNMTEILWFRLLNPNGSCQLLPRRPRLVRVNRLEGLSLPRNSATINWPAGHDLVVDWAVNLQHKQTNRCSTKIFIGITFDDQSHITSAVKQQNQMRVCVHVKINYAPRNLLLTVPWRCFSCGLF